jgi:hypothetical protein
MKKVVSLFYCLVVVVAQATAVTDNAQLWAKGNACYKAGQYDSARALYEQIAQQKPDNACLYYNLGNTYYRLNKIGPAVLNYERAIRLDPEYRLAKENILLTKRRMTGEVKQIEDIFFVRWWDAATAPGNATTWAACSLVCFVLAIASLLVKIMTGGKVVVPAQVTVLLVVLWCCLLPPAIASASKSVDSGRVVVMENDVPLNHADTKGKPIGLIPEGTVLKLKNTNGNLAEVVMPDGRSGWVQLSAIAKI